MTLCPRAPHRRWRRCNHRCHAVGRIRRGETAFQPTRFHYGQLGWPKGVQDLLVVDTARPELLERLEALGEADCSPRPAPQLWSWPAPQPAERALRWLSHSKPGYCATTSFDTQIDCNTQPQGALGLKPD